MKNLSKKTIKLLLNGLWRGKYSDASRIIYYHSVHPNNPGSHHPDMFRLQLQWLFDNDYICPALSEFENVYQQKKVVFITFDDGYQDNWDYAVPILKEFNFKATFFICSEYVNKEGNFSALEGHQLAAGLTMLNERSLLLLKQAGMDVGSHGVSHRMMSRLSHEEQRHELLSSRKKLEQILSDDVISYAYPNGQKGACTEYANEEAMQLGYQYVCSTLWGSCNKKSPILNRCEMSSDDSMHDFISKITGKRDYRTYIDKLIDKSTAWSIES